MSDLAKRGEQGLTSLKDVKGLPEVDQELMEIPRLKIVQALSEEAKSGAAIPGQFVNSVTGDIIADKGGEVIFTPIMFKKSRVMFDKSLGVACIAIDGKIGEGDPGGVCANCKFAQWIKDAEGNNVQLCSEVLNFVGVIDGDSMPIMLSFMKTGFKTGRKLYNLIIAAGYKGMSPWHRKYKLSAKWVEDKGGYYIPQILPAGNNEPEMIEFYDGLFESLQGVEIKTDYEAEPDTVTGTTVSPDTATNDKESDFKVEEKAPWE